MSLAAPVLYAPNNTTLRLSTEVSMESMRWLVDEAEFAFRYLKCPRVTVELDSRGGETQGLEYWLYHVRRWQAAGLVVATRAVGAAESAAAVMLSHGTLGWRTALPTARILFHEARVIAQGREMWTRHTLERHRERVEDLDTRLIDGLLYHILGAQASPPAPSPACANGELRQRFAELWAQDRHIAPAEACALGLIDGVEDA